MRRVAAVAASVASGAAASVALAATWDNPFPVMAAPAAAAGEAAIPFSAGGDGVRRSPELPAQLSHSHRQTWRGSRFGETCTSMPVGTARGEVQHLTDYYGFVIALTASECAICATSSDG